MSRLRALVLGGYGFFGQRLVRSLSSRTDLHLQVAGRSFAAAQALVRQLEAHSPAQLEAIALDAQSPLLTENLRRLAPDVLINASGPFQQADYRIPDACIAAGIHYIDLADGRDYVLGIEALDARARAAGVVVTSGASSVPALSSAAADHLAQGLGTVDAIDIGISPGNRTERGLSTIRGILSYCGQRIPVRGDAAVFGWTGTHRHDYPSPVGTRLLSPCDVPDLSLFPLRYAGTPEVRFGAGLELWFLHRGMNAMAWMARAGLVRDWSRHANLLKRLADLFRHWGSDDGAMHVTVRGRDASGSQVIRTWQLIATRGDGPFVPTLAAAALVRKLQQGTLRPGAHPCVGILTLGDFTREMDGLAIRTETTP